MAIRPPIALRRRVERVRAKIGRRFPGCDQCHSFARLTFTLAEVTALTRPEDQVPF
jgi:hypothetical protein